MTNLIATRYERIRAMSKFDPDKSYSIGVWDMTFYVVDDEKEDYVRNTDGSIKIFYAANMDYSYMADGLGVDGLEEVDDEWE
jgi:hypothetical protein